MTLLSGMHLLAKASQARPRISCGGSGLTDIAPRVASSTSKDHTERVSIDHLLLPEYLIAGLLSNRSAAPTRSAQCMLTIW